MSGVDLHWLLTGGRSIARLDETGRAVQEKNVPPPCPGEPPAPRPCPAGVGGHVHVELGRLVVGPYKRNTGSQASRLFKTNGVRACTVAASSIGPPGVFSMSRLWDES